MADKSYAQLDKYYMVILEQKMNSMFTNKLLWTYRIMFVQPPDVVWQLEI